ncbi:MAG TPA: quinol:electron acceptor oxidoreductase subunit ActD [Anaerolineales bacterium]|nr:quinol:electron acceptor oxidoreductase subunit ActD [Anaerolineales bacterium]
MSENTRLIALFSEEDHAADGIAKLHQMGITDENISVISGVPIAEAVLGRPRPESNVSKLALGGAIAGFLFGAFLNFGTPQLYTIYVGGQSILPIPPGMIILFEMTMLFMLLATFLGVFLDSFFPNYRPLEYVPEVSDGKIAVFFTCPKSEQKKFTDALVKLGAESVESAEARHL